MKTRNPDTALNTPRENDNPWQAEKQKSLNDYSLLIFAALQVEHQYLITEANLEAADALWSLARQRAIANDPAAHKAQQKCQRIRDQFLVANEQKKTYSSLGPKVEELKKELEKANNSQVRSCNYAIRNDDRVLKAVVELEQARAAHKISQSKLEQARNSLLQTLEKTCRLKLAWNEIESLLDSRTKALIVENCLQLAEMQTQQDQQLSEMTQALYSYIYPKLRQKNNGSKVGR